MKNNELMRSINFDNDHPENVLPVNLDVEVSATINSSDVTILMNTETVQQCHKEGRWGDMVSSCEIIT
jgi:hypothetical protein